MKEGIDEISDEVYEIAHDRIHGSSWILARTMKLLKKVDPELRPEICKKISSSHPVMAGLKALSGAIARDPFYDGEKKVLNANERTSRNLQNILDGKTVTTISRSHIVEKGLLKAREILVLESMPGGEGRALVEWLKNEFGGDVTLVQDAVMGYAVRKSDFVVVGADSISDSGFINKVGTLPLALTAGHFQKPFIVASPSYKFVEDFEGLDGNLGFDPSTSLFEFVDIKYVDLIVWESGFLDLNLRRSALDEIKKASRKFFND